MSNTTSSALTGYPQQIQWSADMLKLRKRDKTDAKVFIISGVSSDAERKELSTKIKQLKGCYYDKKEFKASCCTHVICGKLSRSEKFLGAVATGKWVLHPDYVNQSYSCRKWLQEDQFEWCAETIIRHHETFSMDMAVASRRWRFTLGPGNRAFTGWTVALMVSGKRCITLKRLLISGGAEVFTVKMPIKDPASIADRIGYVFVSASNLADASRLVDYGVLCLQPEFIADYLIKDPPPDPMDYLVQPLERSGPGIPSSPSSQSFLHSSSGSFLNSTTSSPFSCRAESPFSIPMSPLFRSITPVLTSTPSTFSGNSASPVCVTISPYSGSSASPVLNTTSPFSASSVSPLSITTSDFRRKSRNSATASATSDNSAAEKHTDASAADVSTTLVSTSDHVSPAEIPNENGTTTIDASQLSSNEMHHTTLAGRDQTNISHISLSPTKCSDKQSRKRHSQESVNSRLSRSPIVKVTLKPPDSPKPRKVRRSVNLFKLTETNTSAKSSETVKVKHDNDSMAQRVSKRLLNRALSSKASTCLYCSSSQKNVPRSSVSEDCEKLIVLPATQPERQTNPPERPLISNRQLCTGTPVQHLATACQLFTPDQQPSTSQYLLCTPEKQQSTHVQLSCSPKLLPAMPRQLVSSPAYLASESEQIKSLQPGTSKQSNYRRSEGISSTPERPVYSQKQSCTPDAIKSTDELSGRSLTVNVKDNIADKYLAVVRVQPLQVTDSQNSITGSNRETQRGQINSVGNGNNQLKNGPSNVITGLEQVRASKRLQRKPKKTPKQCMCCKTPVKHSNLKHKSTQNDTTVNLDSQHGTQEGLNSQKLDICNLEKVSDYSSVSTSNRNKLITTAPSDKVPTIDTTETNSSTCARLLNMLKKYKGSKKLSVEEVETNRTEKDTSRLNKLIDYKFTNAENDSKCNNEEETKHCRKQTKHSRKTQRTKSLDIRNFFNPKPKMELAKENVNSPTKVFSATNALHTSVSVFGSSQSGAGTDHRSAVVAQDHTTTTESDMLVAEADLPNIPVSNVIPQSGSVSPDCESQSKIDTQALETHRRLFRTNVPAGDSIQLQSPIADCSSGSHGQKDALSSSRKRKSRYGGDLPHILRDIKRRKISDCQWRPSMFSVNHREEAIDSVELSTISTAIIQSQLDEKFTLSAVRELNTRLSLKYYPQQEMVEALMNQVLMTAGSVLEARRVYLVLVKLTSLHPPTTPEIISLFISWDWPFLKNILTNLTTGDCEDMPSFNHMLLLRYMMAVLEQNLQHWLAETQKGNQIAASRNILLRIMWSPSYHVVVNRRCRELLDLMAEILLYLAGSDSAQTTQHLTELLGHVAWLVGMAAEICRVSEFGSQEGIKCLQCAFVHELSRRIIAFGIHDGAILHTIFSSLRFPWICVGVCQQILGQMDDYLLAGDHLKDSQALSLSVIVSRCFFLLPRLVETQPKSVTLSQKSESQAQDQRHVEGSIHGAAVDQVDLNRTVSRARKKNAKGIDVNARDNAGWTPLHEACNHGNIKCVQELLKFVPAKTMEHFFMKDTILCKKVDILACTDEGITPLHDAVLNGKTEVVRVLLQHGGSKLLSAKTCLGYTPIDLAESPELCSLLMSHLPSNSQRSDSQESCLSQESFTLVEETRREIPCDLLYEQALGTGDARIHADRRSLVSYIRIVTFLVKSYLAATDLLSISDRIQAENTRQATEGSEPFTCDNLNEAGSGGNVNSIPLEVNSIPQRKYYNENVHMRSRNSELENDKVVLHGRTLSQNNDSTATKHCSQEMGGSIHGSFYSNDSYSQDVPKEEVRTKRADLRVLRNMDKYIRMFKLHLFKLCEDEESVEKEMFALHCLA